MHKTSDQLIRTVIHLNRLIAQRQSQQRSAARFSQLQLETLEFIASATPVRLSTIATQVHVSLPSATQLLQRLERQGLVRRERNPSDRRSVQFSLSPRGRTSIRQHTIHRQRQLKHLFNGVSTAQLRQLVIILQRMHRNVSHHH